MDNGIVQYMHDNGKRRVEYVATGDWNVWTFGSR